MTCKLTIARNEFDPLYKKSQNFNEYQISEDVMEWDDFDASRRLKRCVRLWEMVAS